MPTLESRESSERESRYYVEIVTSLPPDKKHRTSFHINLLTAGQKRNSPVIVFRYGENRFRVSWHVTLR
ncbi:hypothetical protein Bpfe_010006, partial [Biomphalaria pfeifferi]